MLTLALARFSHVMTAVMLERGPPVAGPRATMVGKIAHCSLRESHTLPPLDGGLWSSVMNKRLTMLEELVSSGKADSFARYGLAMEYRKEKRHEEALGAFQALREADPSYLPAYLMAGQLLLETSKNEDAKEWLTAGIARASERGDGKTLAELEDALSEC